jgi:subtilisin family serine protease
VDGQRVGLLFLQVWHRREDAIVVRLRGPNGESFQPPQNAQREFDRAVFLVQASHQRAPYSGDHTTTFIITAHPLDQWLSGWSIIAEEHRSKGQSGVAVGTIHAWIVDREMGGFTSGTTASHLVGMPGTAFSAITVAAHATRKEWTSQDPNSSSVTLDQVHLQDISHFSSPGPTRDGVNKPEVAAPGQWLISTLSHAASPEWVPAWTRIADIDFAAMQGTSMAAPYVTGALALLLEKEPTIDWSEAKRRLIRSTHQDGFTRQCWNPRWGYGKIDVKRLLELTS